jgi:repressor LexA
MSKKKGDPVELSDLQLKVYTFFRDQLKANGRPPSIRDVGRHAGISPPNNAIRVIRELINMGHIADKDAPGGPAGQRGPARLVNLVVPDEDVLLPYRGKVSCGTGAENDEDFEHAPMNISDMFRKSDLAVFEATGNSMRDALIAEGDILFVRENPEPPVGSVVIAMYGRDFVCKKLTKRSRSRVRLESCNAAEGYEPLDFDPARLPSFRILGVLHSVLRKL